jgi:hypothetical protein
MEAADNEAFYKSGENQDGYNYDTIDQIQEDQNVEYSIDPKHMEEQEDQPSEEQKSTKFDPLAQVNTQTQA